MRKIGTLLATTVLALAGTVVLSGRRERHPARHPQRVDRTHRARQPGRRARRLVAAATPATSSRTGSRSPARATRGRPCSSATARAWSRTRPAPRRRAAGTARTTAPPGRAASDVDIDHVVPLAAAWRTGASVVDHGPAPGVRERPVQPAADRGDGQRQPVEGRPDPGDLEAAAHGVLVHLREDVDPREVPVLADGQLDREGRAVPGCSATAEPPTNAPGSPGPGAFARSAPNDRRTSPRHPPFHSELLPGIDRATFVPHSRVTLRRDQ